VEATEAFYHRKKALRLSNNAAQEKVRREALDVQHSGPYNAEEHLADAYKR
jgi:stress response protein YsnF|tara:strand:+ start:2383 stop:2535 length:153 start_codon:yes stop_codon:yes gene_type:complete